MRELLNRTVAWKAVNGTDGLVEIPTLFDGEYEVRDDRAMAPPQHRRESSPRRAGRRAGPPGCHERAGRSHPLGPPRNPTQAARASRGVSTRDDRRLLIDPRATSSLLPQSPYAARCFPTVCARCQSFVGRVVRRAIRNVARRAPPSASSRLRPASSGSMARRLRTRRLTGESPLGLIVQRSH